jgi:hypothetical protein
VALAGLAAVWVAVALAALGTAQSAAEGGRAQELLQQVRKKTAWQRQMKQQQTMRKSTLQERASKAPARPRMQMCSADGGVGGGMGAVAPLPRGSARRPGCFFAGLQVALVDDHGMVFCRDCPDPHLEGGFSALRRAARRGEARRSARELEGMAACSVHLGGAPRPTRL